MKKKRTLAVVLLGLLVVCASAGIGFAINYYGQIANTTNDAEAEYLLLSIDGNNNGVFDEAADYVSGFESQIAFNTVRTASTVTWSYADGVDTETVDGNLCASLGSVVILVVPSATSKTFDLEMVRTAGTMESDVTFYATATGCTDPVQLDSDTFTFEGLTTTSADPVEVEVTLYAYLDLSQYDDTDYPPATLLDDVTFTFTATATL